MNSRENEHCSAKILKAKTCCIHNIPREKMFKETIEYKGFTQSRIQESLWYLVQKTKILPTFFPAHLQNLINFIHYKENKSESRININDILH